MACIAWRYNCRMSDLLDNISAAKSIDEALSIIISDFKADSGSIHLLADDGMLHLKASRGIPDVVVHLVRVIPIGKGMAGLAAQRREAVTVCNLQTDSSGDVRPGAKTTGMEGAIVVPILNGETVVGTLGIANRNERTFSKEETDLLIECGREVASIRDA